MKRFTRGLVVGKFSPLHEGHEVLLREALRQCEQLVVISYSKPEFAGCEAARRTRWLNECLPQAQVLVVTPEMVTEWQRAGMHVPDMPANDAPDAPQREFTARLCSEVLNTTVDAVFTGEDYGDGFAAALARHFGSPVLHVPVERPLDAMRVSGTRLRADPHGLRRFLAPGVYGDFVQRIAFLGGESSGKTTICAALAAEFGTQWVPEYGRWLWESKAGQLVFDDYVHIARTQLEHEETARRKAERYVFCDTTVLTTLWYCLDQFGRADPELALLARTPYDKIYLCEPDFPMVQDGTRRDEAFRQRQFAWYQAELQAMGMDFELLSGSHAQRLAKLKLALPQSR